MKLFTFLFVLLLSVSTAYPQNQETLKFFVKNSSVRIVNANVSSNCCSKYAFEVIHPVISKGAFFWKVFETDTTGPLCDCMCKFDLETNLNSLNQGHYVVEVYRRELKKYGYSEDLEIFIGRDSFDINTEFMPPISFAFKQWNCNIPADVSDEAVTENSLIAYPNPATTGNIYIDFGSAGQSDIILSVTDVFGREVYQMEFPTGKKSIILKSDDLPPGIYLCKIYNNTGISKFCKINILK